jgi:transcriptional/translational regulatory protein YebC/TACO1
MVVIRAVTIKSIRAIGRIKIPTKNKKVQITKSSSINYPYDDYGSNYE